MADIRRILSDMTIDEKIGQLTQYTAEVLGGTGGAVTGPAADLGLTAEEVNTVGSVLNFKDSVEAIALQKAHLQADRHHIPLLTMMDVIHGFRTIYPIPLALGCSFDTALTEACSRMAAKEAVAGGVHVTFTPMVDLARDARWGRIMETCSEDVLINSDMGAAQVRGFQGDDLKSEDSIAACVKHFAAYGGAEAGRDYNQVELSEHVLREYYLPAYKACLDAGAVMLMPSFNVLNGVPSVANSWLMKTILQDEWHFDGVVISDYDAIGELIAHGIAEDAADAATLAFNNDCTIDMCSTSYMHHLKTLVENGTISEAHLDRAVLKVLELKNKLGLFENPYRGASKTAQSPRFLTKEHRALAAKAAEDCAVLLKNDGILPLKKGKQTIALIGPFADSHDILGAWFCNGRQEESVSVKEGIAALVPEATILTAVGCDNTWDSHRTDGFNEAIAIAKAADVVILCLGEPSTYSGEGNSRTDLRLPGMQEQLVDEIVKYNPNTVAVTFSGRPLVLSAVNDLLPAILHMWFPGTEGGTAVANLLFGEANPGGKLSVSFPKVTGQCPIYYNHTRTGRPAPAQAETQHIPFRSNYIDCGNMPLYAFGHGLSYSRFVYDNLALSSDHLTAGGTIDVNITIHNDSDRAGDEIVLLFMRDTVASTARPVQQLIAYQKVSFAAHERKTVHFIVDEPMLRFYNTAHQHVSEAGRFELSTGCADHLLLTTSFELTGC